MPHAQIIDDRIHVAASFQEKDICKSINGARWAPDTKTWHYPVTATVARDLSMAFNGKSLTFDDGVRELIKMATIAEKAGVEKYECDPPQPPSKTESWLHQRQCHRFAMSLPYGAMLALDMRCGKSKTAIDIANAKKAQRILITCPLSVVPVWSGEFAKHSFDTFEVMIPQKRTVHQRTKEAEFFVSLMAARKQACAVVVNHEALWRTPFDIFVKRTGFDLLIVDECHRGKDPRGKFSKFLWQGTRHIPYSLGLTGTPMPHSPLDIFAQYRFIDEGVFGTSYWKFRDKYAVMGGWENKQVVGYQNQEEFRRRVESLMYRITKDEAFDLPPEIFETRYCLLDDKARKAYDDLEKDFFMEVEEGQVTAANALVKLLRLQQITSGYFKDDSGKIEILHSAKRDLLADLIKNEVKPPFVVFARFTHDIEMIKEVCEENGLSCGEISGRQKDTTDTGHMPEDLDAMAVQIQAGGLGINLSRASTAIYVSVGFNLAEYLQCQARCRKFDEHWPVAHIHLVVQNTIDEDVYMALENRHNAVEAVLARVKR